MRNSFAVSLARTSSCPRAAYCKKISHHSICSVETETTPAVVYTILPSLSRLLTYLYTLPVYWCGGGEKNFPFGKIFSSLHRHSRSCAAFETRFIFVNLIIKYSEHYSIIATLLLLLLLLCLEYTFSVLYNYLKIVRPKINHTKVVKIYFYYQNKQFFRF